jgi:hypothetical protein
LLLILDSPVALKLPLFWSNCSLPVPSWRFGYRRRASGSIGQGCPMNYVQATPVPYVIQNKALTFLHQLFKFVIIYDNFQGTKRINSQRTWAL